MENEGQPDLSHWSEWTTDVPASLEHEAMYWAQYWRLQCNVKGEEPRAYDSTASFFSKDL